MRLAVKNIGVEITKAGIGVGKLPARKQQGGVKAGTGFDVTKSSRNRRISLYSSGPAASPDRHMDKRTLGQLRETSRDYDRQGSIISGILDRAQDNIVGANFEFNPNTGDKELDKKIKEYIVERMLAENCDASGVRDFAEMMKSTIRAAWTDGDNLWTKRPDGSVMVFEADQVETPPGQRGGIVLGVEMTPQGRHKSYHIKQRKMAPNGGFSGTATGTIEIPAANAFMPAFRKRFGQTRGVPFLASALAHYNRFHNYLDFESLAAEANATQGIKITKKNPENTRPGVVDNDDTSTNDTFSKVQKLEPLQILELLEGEDVGMFGADRPGSNFDPYVVMSMRIIGVAIGYPLELVMLDFSRTNYSSARASMAEARRSFRGWQKWCQKSIAMPWYKWQIVRGIAAGAFAVNPKVFNVRYQWPGWEYIDPKKSAEANKISIAEKIKSRSQCIRDIGGEPDEVFAEIASDDAKLKELGISTAVPANIFGDIKPDEDVDETNRDETNENDDASQEATE